MHFVEIQPLLPMPVILYLGGGKEEKEGRKYFINKPVLDNNTFTKHYIHIYIYIYTCIYIYIYI